MFIFFERLGIKIFCCVIKDRWWNRNNVLLPTEVQPAPAVSEGEIWENNKDYDLAVFFMIFINQRQMCCCLSFIENIFEKEKCKENEMSELISSASFCVKIVSHCPKKNAILRKSLLSCHFLQDPTKRIQKFGETVALLESFVVRAADFSRVLTRGWRCRLEILLLLLLLIVISASKSSIRSKSEGS